MSHEEVSKLSDIIASASEQDTDRHELTDDELAKVSGGGDLRYNDDTRFYVGMENYKLGDKGKTEKDISKNHF